MELEDEVQTELGSSESSNPYLKDVMMVCKELYRGNDCYIKVCSC